MNILEIIQAASAVYIIVLATIGLATVIQYVVTGEPVSRSTKGVAATLGVVAAVICAVTTIGALG